MLPINDHHDRNANNEAAALVYSKRMIIIGFALC